MNSRAPKPENPNLEWYARLSREAELPPRCPYASVNRCPRYYLSLSILGQHGSTSIPERQDESLFKMWERSDAWLFEHAEGIAAAQPLTGALELARDHLDPLGKALLDRLDETTVGT